MANAINKYLKKFNIVALAFLLFFSLLCSGEDFVYAKEKSALVNLELQTRIMSSGGAGKEQIPTTSFSFELTSEDPGAPMPELKRVSIDGEGKASFTLPFNKIGIFDYQIRQTTKWEQDWKLDNKVYDVTVVVKEDEQGGLITAVVGSVKGSEEKSSSFLFENYYTKKVEPKNPGELDGKKPGAKPDTGDTANVYTYMYAGLGSLLLALSLIISRRKKRNDATK